MPLFAGCVHIVTSRKIFLLLNLFLLPPRGQRNQVIPGLWRYGGRKQDLGNKRVTIENVKGKDKTHDTFKSVSISWCLLLLSFPCPGNAAVVKPSEVCVHTAKAMEDLLPLYIDKVRKTWKWKWNKTCTDIVSWASKWWIQEKYTFSNRIIFTLNKNTDFWTW